MQGIWAIADLHLCISCPNKTMEDFGPSWSNYIERIKANWIENISEEDLVLIAGDITWALKIDEAKVDLEWLGALPGTKVMIRGNHDYWWKSLTQLRRILPPKMHVLHNDALNLPELSIAGSRLWDTLEYNFSDLIEFKTNPKANPKVAPLSTEENERIFEKELHRLELSLSKMNPDSPLKIAMTHYPPISQDLKPSRAHSLLLKYKVNKCVFGHMHNLKETPASFFGQKDGIEYIFTAADYLKFIPKKIL